MPSHFSRITPHVKASTLLLVVQARACTLEPPSAWSGYAEADYLSVAAP